MPALTDLIGGQIQVLVNPALSAVPHVRSGKLRAIAVTEPVRSAMGGSGFPIASHLSFFSQRNGGGRRQTMVATRAWKQTKPRAGSCFSGPKSSALVSWTALLLTSPVCGQGDATTYPQRPVRLIDPYAPGGGSGLIARLLSDKLSPAWGKQIVVDNRPGAAAAIGTEMAAKAAPDGHTLLMGTSGSIAINPGMYAKLPYDPVRDLVAITQTSAQVNVLVLHPSVNASSVKELIALAASQPGKLNFSSAATGSTGHLAGELFQGLAKVRMTHVAYRGSSPAAIAVIAGEVELMFGNVLAVLPHVNSGKLKAIAVSSRERTKALPNLPTIAEAGVPGYEALGWNGVFAPAGTPRPIVAKLNRDIVGVLNMPDVRERLESMGSNPVGGTPEQFGAYVKREIARWGKIIRDNNIRIE
ncbi:MAG: tripartite tricarboxylate transporter substrate binding protein [Betaproteobacteria bacterium]|nr:tripartite tricarboxylate transporter substrate binding protein [Betaproteobacteria bacterium]